MVRRNHVRLRKFGIFEMGLYTHCVYPKASQKETILCGNAVSKIGFELDQVKEYIRNQSSRDKDDEDNNDNGEGNFWNVDLLAAFEAAHSYQASGSTERYDLTIRVYRGYIPFSLGVPCLDKRGNHMGLIKPPCIVPRIRVLVGFSFFVPIGGCSYGDRAKAQ